MQRHNCRRPTASCQCRERRPLSGTNRGGERTLVPTAAPKGLDLHAAYADPVHAAWIKASLRLGHPRRRPHCQKSTCRHSHRWVAEITWLESSRRRSPQVLHRTYSHSYPQGLRDFSQPWGATYPLLERRCLPRLSAAARSIAECSPGVSEFGRLGMPIWADEPQHSTEN